jgi:hypothetical protein
MANNAAGRLEALRRHLSSATIDGCNGMLCEIVSCFGVMYAFGPLVARAIAILSKVATGHKCRRIIGVEMIALHVYNQVLLIVYDDSIAVRLHIKKYWKCPTRGL